jgi:hypothetical protein
VADVPACLPACVCSRLQAPKIPLAAIGLIMAFAFAANVCGNRLLQCDSWQVCVCVCVCVCVRVWLLPGVVQCVCGSRDASPLSAVRAPPLSAVRVALP